MKTLLLLLAAVVLILVGVALIAGANKRGKGRGEKPKPKALMTEREQAMYNRLVQALPELVVLAQVSFSALLTARSYAARNTFDRKVADFVVCDKAFRVLAVVELDDSSHRGREKEDGARDVLLVNAGYRVLRYPRVPDVDRVRDDFESPAAPTMPAELMDMRAER
jgi:very-short-patch-repair endonuclease